MSFYERIGAILPKSLRKRLSKSLAYVDIEMSETRFAGFLVIFSVGLGIIASIAAYLLYGFPGYLSFPIATMLFAGIALYWLKIVSLKKAEIAEKFLPDALELIASNIKTGMTTERALFESARDEFGPLSREFKVASRKIITGQRTEVALSEIPKKINSPLLERTISLLIHGIRSGGQITDLLFQLSDSIREENAIKEEINANISMYIMMIFITAAFGAPILFGISSYIVGIVSERSTQYGPSNLPENTSIGVAGRITMLTTDTQKEKVSEEFIVFFAEIALVITAIFSSLAIGVIQTGNEINGIRYIPVILFIDFFLFFFVRSTLGTLMGQMGFL
ncbi:MAG: type II secretion system F family protein [Candidatus Diapherotrites archaeon]